MKIIHEIDRVVVEFASILGSGDHYPLCAESQIWLVCETTAPGTPGAAWRPVGNIDWAYSQMSRLCESFAIEAELKQRLVDGKSLKAEDYIGLWRSAIKAPRSLADLGDDGIELQGKVLKPLKGLLDENTRSPEKGILDLIESPFVTEKTGEHVAWVVPLTDLTNLKAYTRLRSIWINTEKYPDQVCEVQAVSRNTCRPPKRPAVPMDLFSAMEVAA